MTRADLDLDRARENEETFARANEQIRTAAEHHRLNPVPFLCECSDPRCTVLIHLNLNTYRHIRETGGFLLCPGHDDPHVEHTLEDHESYVIVEKFRAE